MHDFVFKMRHTRGVINYVSKKLNPLGRGHQIYGCPE